MEEYDRDDVELIYQPIASGINDLKAQMSRSAYYGLLVLAAVVGLFRLYDDVVSGTALLVLTSVLIVIGGISTCISIYHITRSEELILRRRNIVSRLERSYLKSEAKAMLHGVRRGDYHKWTCDWTFFVPFLASLFVGYVLIVFYLTLEVDGSGIFLAFLCIPMTGFIGYSAACIGKLVDP